MKKEHEISTLKRIGGDVLRMGEPKGVRVVHVYDPAVVDYVQWYKWKRGKGVYVLTLQKSNMVWETIGIQSWDTADSRNIGVVSDELVASSNGHALRRVTYIDPVTGKTYCFITDEHTLPPGLIAFLYKQRWDVEKVFDQIKNKTFEKKAWADSKTSKTQQAIFIALAHNLMRILEIRLEQEEGLVDQKAALKRRARMAEDVAKAHAAGRVPNPLVTAWCRATQRCCQFIRWLRHSLETPTPWTKAVDQLKFYKDTQENTCIKPEISLKHRSMLKKGGQR